MTQNLLNVSYKDRVTSCSYEEPLTIFKMETTVVLPHLKVAWNTKDDSAGHSEKNTVFLRL